MKLAVLSLIGAVSLTPVADPWIGTWVLNRSRSHFVGSSLTIGRIRGGYHFDFGATSFDIGDDGKFYNAYGNRSTSLKALSTDSWLRVHRLNGKEVDHSTITIMPDQAHMIINTTSRADAHKSQEVMTRVGRGQGLAGDWRSTNAGTGVSEIIELSDAGAGRLKWSLPKEEQYYVVSLSGEPAVSNGPHAVAGVTVSLTVSSSHHLRWTEFLAGKPYTRGSDILSQDGRTLTETTWPVQHPGEQQKAVYEKR